MILYPDCDLLSPNMIACEDCYRYDICSKCKENEMVKLKSAIIKQEKHRNKEKS